jgi:hypothetical protein
VPTFKLALSGDVVQSINPFTALLSPIGSQFGLININVGQSSDPSVEADVLTDVAGYGKQLGRIEDVLTVLLKHFKLGNAEEKTAIDAFKELVDGVAKVKEKHNRPALTTGSRP